MTESVCSYIQSPQQIQENSKDELNIFEITTIQVEQLSSLLLRIDQVAQQNLKTSLDHIQETFQYLAAENFEEKLDQKEIKQFCGDYPSEFANNLKKLHEGVIELNNQYKNFLLLTGFVKWIGELSPKTYLN